MSALLALWHRLLGMRPRNAVHWRAWAIEQAVASGAPSYDVDRAAERILGFVFRDEVQEASVVHLKAA